MFVRGAKVQLNIDNL